MIYFSSRVDEIDVQIDKIHRLIERAIREDPELSSGIATTESMSTIQRKIDQACASAGLLEGNVTDILRERYRR